ncbi:hypothetical protein, partial [Rhizobium chutanense]|uniref:hypothetical protein n=1 Tax=Rhizobium chutanense TaxID=2035448 RepID=UPI001AEC8E15
DGPAVKSTRSCHGTTPPERPRLVAYIHVVIVFLSSAIVLPVDGRHAIIIDTHVTPANWHAAPSISIGSTASGTVSFDVKAAKWKPAMQHPALAIGGSNEVTSASTGIATIELHQHPPRQDRRASAPDAQHLTSCGKAISNRHKEGSRTLLCRRQVTARTSLRPLPNSDPRGKKVAMALSKAQKGSMA